MTSSSAPLPTRGRAIVLTAAGAVPVIETRDVRPPRRGEALVAVEAVGICGSDRLLMEGGFGDVFPVVPGHEAAGRVIAVGDPTDDSWVGRRVGLYYLDSEKGGSLPGRPNLGPGIRRMGVDVDGALAEYVVRPVSTLVDAGAIDAVAAAVLTDALATPHHALGLAGVDAGSAVAVIGVGGIGSGAVQLAALRGADVLAIGRTEESAELARRMGAREHRTSDLPAADLADALGRPLDVVVQCVGDPAADRLAVDIAGIGATVVLVGASVRPFSVSSTELIWKGLTVIGSRGFTPEDIVAVMAEHRAGRLRIDHLTSTVVGLEDAPAALLGRVPARGARVVVTPRAGGDA